MSSYRRMRRQARHARRHGMRPMMVINSGDQLPETAALIVIRAAWRYRSELTPLYLAAVLLGAGWWLHATHPHWWPYLLGIATAAAWALAIFGAKTGIPALAERLYAATVTLTAGGWLAAATAAGPVTSPLPQALMIGGTVLAVPWWAHRRRRAGSASNASCKPGPRSPKPSACLAHRSCLRWWTCGAGGPASGWPAARPSPMWWPRFPRWNQR